VVAALAGLAGIGLCWRRQEGSAMMVDRWQWGLLAPDAWVGT
jgi:hypothetical protein